MQRFVRVIAGPVAASMMLAGCGGIQSAVQPVASSRAFTFDRAAVAGPGRAFAARLSFPRAASDGARPTWMRPDAKAQDLLYVSDFPNNVVDVLSYPGGEQVGSLGGFHGPEGACTDAKGNVWIANQDAFEIVEYAHGGTSPIATLSLPQELIDGCSVDLATGTLAVDSYCEVSSNFTCIENGSVFVYTDTQKPPQQYSVVQARVVYFCGYDSHGDLFVDADQTGGDVFVLAELRSGASAFTAITLDRHIYYPGGVQWHGKYLAVGDQNAGNELTSSVHRVRVKGSRGTVVGTTKLEGVGDVVQFWIQGSTIVAPNIGEGEPSDVRLFDYPVGGTPTIVGGGFNQPIGSTVSLARR